MTNLRSAKWAARIGGSLVKDQIVLLYTTWPDAETAEEAAAVLVADRLAACANIIGGMRSIYRWQGAVERSVETVVIFKTTAQAAPALRDRIAACHPHETPCVLGLPVDAAASHGAYLDWLTGEVPSPNAAPEG
jgi:periplasmic divalent cation tolerance protein